MTSIELKLQRKLEVKGNDITNFKQKFLTKEGKHEAIEL